MGRFRSEALTVIKRLGPSVAYWSESAGALVLRAFSVEDKKEYKIIMFENEDYPGDPPDIYVIPYPVYVKEENAYKKSHIRQCCFEKTSESGILMCFFHIDKSMWRGIRKDVKGNGSRLLVAVLMNVLQALSLRLPMLSYNLSTHRGRRRYA